MSKTVYDLVRDNPTVYMKEIGDMNYILRTPVSNQLLHKFQEINLYRGVLETDRMKISYKGIDEKACEEYRKECLQVIDSINDPKEKLKYFMKSAKMLSETIQFMAYNYTCSMACHKSFLIDLIDNMYGCDLSLSKMVEYIPRVTHSMVYQILENDLGCDVILTEEENRILAQKGYFE